jgi:hypothetical protein
MFRDDKVQHPRLLAFAWLEDDRQELFRGDIPAKAGNALERRPGNKHANLRLVLDRLVKQDGAWRNDEMPNHKLIAFFVYLLLASVDH